MDKKKVFLGIVFGFLISLVVMPFVSAGLFELSDIGLGGNETLFVRGLLFVLIFILSFTALDRFIGLEDRRGLNLLISFAIAATGAWFISENQLVYGVLEMMLSIGIV